MNALPPVSMLTLTGDYALAAIPARAAIELGNWEQAGTLKVREGAVPWARAITWAAIGEGSGAPATWIAPPKPSRLLRRFAT